MGAATTIERVLETSLYFCAFMTALAPPAAGQTTDLSTRSFWVGERPLTMDDDMPFVALREIDWIEAVLGTDPTLRDAVVHIDFAHTPMPEAVAARASEAARGSASYCSRPPCRTARMLKWGACPEAAIAAPEALSRAAV